MLFLQKLSEPLGTQKIVTKLAPSYCLPASLIPGPENTSSWPGTSTLFKHRAMTQVKVSPAPQGGE